MRFLLFYFFLYFWSWFIGDADDMMLLLLLPMPLLILVVMWIFEKYLHIDYQAKRKFSTFSASSRCYRITILCSFV